MLSGSVNTSEFSSKPRFTGPDGRMRIGYTCTGGAAKETLTVTVTPEPTGGAVTGMGDTGAVRRGCARTFPDRAISK